MTSSIFSSGTSAISLGSSYPSGFVGGTTSGILSISVGASFAGVSSVGAGGVSNPVFGNCFGSSLGSFLPESHVLSLSIASCIFLSFIGSGFSSLGFASLSSTGSFFLITETSYSSFFSSSSLVTYLIPHVLLFDSGTPFLIWSLPDIFLPVLVSSGVIGVS